MIRHPRQRIVLIAALALATLAVLFPPWIHVGNYQSRSDPVHAFIVWSDPLPPNFSDHVPTEIDFNRLAGDLIAIAMTAALVIVVLRIRDDKIGLWIAGGLLLLIMVAGALMSLNQAVNQHPPATYAQPPAF